MNSNKKNTKCCLCSEEAVLKYENYPGYQIPSVFDIYYCPSCNTSFSVPRCESNEIYNLIYKNGPAVRWYDRYWENAEAVKIERNPLDYLAESEEIYWAVKESLKQIAKKSTSTLSILEIGCGLGYLTYSLNKAGYHSRGLDISQEAINIAIKNYGNYYICSDLHEYAINHENEFNVIIFTELIEHLNDIFGFIESLRKLLKPEGKIILTTPNKSFFPSTILWATDLPPVHCWWLSEDSINYIAEKLNMEVSFLDFKKYYSMRTSWVDLRDIEIPVTPPVFDKDGKLIGRTTRIFKKEIVIIKLIKKIKIIKYLFTKLRYFIVRNNKNILIPKNRGPVLCAILNKQ